MSGFRCQEKQTENLKPVGAKRQRERLKPHISLIRNPKLGTLLKDGSPQDNSAMRNPTVVSY